MRLPFIVFISGGTVMVVELLGARIIAPYLGSTIYVWTSVIGVILGALSLGYFLGGRLADWRPSWRLFAGALFASGVAIFLLAVTKNEILAFIPRFGWRAGAVIGALLLFTLPSALLGLVAPFAVRLRLKDVATSGHVIGNLYAISTVGSITGTFLTGFVLVPMFSTTMTLYGLALTQAALSFFAWPYLSRCRLRISALTFMVLWSALAAWESSTADRRRNILVRTETPYSQILVFDGYWRDDDRPSRQLKQDAHASSAEYLDDTGEIVVYDYVRMYRLDKIFNAEIKNALLIGGGAYTTAFDFLRRWPGAAMSVVEIDPELTAVAYQYFHIKPTDRLTTSHQDARVFLNDNRQKFDAVYGDAYRDTNSIPWHLTTNEAMSKIADSLNHNGVFLLNVISALDGPKAGFLHSQVKTLSLYFPQVYVFATKPDKWQTQNLMVVAVKSDRRLTVEEMLAKSGDDNRPFIAKLAGDFTPAADAFTLTDDYAPVEFLAAKSLP